MNRTPETLYRLGPLDAEQVHTLSDALDLYARVLMGQFREIADLARLGVLTDSRGQSAAPERIEAAGRLLEQAKEMLTGLAPGVSKGIGGAATPAAAQRAFVLRKVLRHRLARERKPHGTALDGVDFDDPYLMRYTSETHRVELTAHRAGGSRTDDLAPQF